MQKNTRFTEWQPSVMTTSMATMLVHTHLAIYSCNTSRLAIITACEQKKVTIASRRNQQVVYNVSALTNTDKFTQHHSSAGNQHHA